MANQEQGEGQRRHTSEESSWHADMALASQRALAFSKRDSCTGSTTDAEFLLAAGMGLQSSRRTSSATTSYALAAGLLPGLAGAPGALAGSGTGTPPSGAFGLQGSFAPVAAAPPSWAPLPPAPQQQRQVQIGQQQQLLPPHAGGGMPSASQPAPPGPMQQQQQEAQQMMQQQQAQQRTATPQHQQHQQQHQQQLMALLGGAPDGMLPAQLAGPRHHGPGAAGGTQLQVYGERQWTLGERRLAVVAALHAGQPQPQQQPQQRGSFAPVAAAPPSWAPLPPAPQQQRQVQIGQQQQLLPPHAGGGMPSASQPAPPGPMQQQQQEAQQMMQQQQAQQRTATPQHQQHQQQHQQQLMALLGGAPDGMLPAQLAGPRHHGPGAAGGTQLQVYGERQWTLGERRLAVVAALHAGQPQPQQQPQQRVQMWQASRSTSLGSSPSLRNLAGAGLGGQGAEGGLPTQRQGTAEGQLARPSGLGGQGPVWQSAAGLVRPPSSPQLGAPSQTPGAGSFRGSEPGATAADGFPNMQQQQPLLGSQHSLGASPLWPQQRQQYLQQQHQDRQQHHHQQQQQHRDQQEQRQHEGQQHQEQQEQLFDLAPRPAPALLGLPGELRPYSSGLQASQDRTVLRWTGSGGDVAQPQRQLLAREPGAAGTGAALGGAGWEAAAAAAMARASRQRKRQRAAPLPPVALAGPAAAVTPGNNSRGRRRTSMSGVGGGYTGCGGAAAAATPYDTSAPPTGSTRSGSETSGGGGGTHSGVDPWDTFRTGDCLTGDAEAGTGTLSDGGWGGAAGPGPGGANTPTYALAAATQPTATTGGALLAGGGGVGAASRDGLGAAVGSPADRAPLTAWERAQRNRAAAAKSRARGQQYQARLEERCLALQRHGEALRGLLRAAGVALPAELAAEAEALGGGLPARSSPPPSRKGVGGRPRKYPLNPDGSKPKRVRRRTSNGALAVVAAVAAGWQQK
ncbi:hypothetical protein TSOC_000098 [Tetrabaena socialis]|uniref:BZIP domain-containing protein n=1 Tax=Tetrabaena socialis TaxID=47790 RepID=A0A2J8AK64_9CHLO|nr:hypothetical protein TSOC_000098 [Tetrabaena socialis]|eukprot:PNH12907.1 hypothetical protein TSOC_000098 [Tetrabaena socialis]